MGAASCDLTRRYVGGAPLHSYKFSSAEVNKVMQAVRDEFGSVNGVANCIGDASTFISSLMLQKYMFVRNSVQLRFS